MLYLIYSSRFTIQEDIIYYTIVLIYYPIDTLVEKANSYAILIGLRQVPILQKKTVGKMGLKGVAGLRVA